MFNRSLYMKEYIKRPYVMAKRQAYQKRVGTTNRVRSRRVKSHIKSLYGITAERYEEIRVAQRDRCAICSSPPKDNKRLSIDHCHETGVVRGLLCDRCNLVLGHLKDNAYLAMKITDYLL